MDFARVVFTPALPLYFGNEYNKSIVDVGNRNAQSRQKHRS